MIERKNSLLSELNSQWCGVKWVLTDVDDTLTWRGQLPPETLIALAQLQRAGIKVVAVTGACAGWCDHIAQLWPVDAVIGENGAFLMEKMHGKLTVKSQTPLATMRAHQAKLQSRVERLLSKYPELSLTLDQNYRLCEVAIDIGQNRKKVESAVIDSLLQQLKTIEIDGMPVHATASSIHINIWLGQHSKKVTSLQYLASQGLQTEEILQQVCYVGDSMNDQQMFEYLPLSVGVANIRHVWDQLEHKPQVIMEEPGGYGFAAFSKRLLTKINEQHWQNCGESRAECQ